MDVLTGGGQATFCVAGADEDVDDERLCGAVARVDGPRLQPFRCARANTRLIQQSDQQRHVGRDRLPRHLLSPYDRVPVSVDHQIVRVVGHLEQIRPQVGPEVVAVAGLGAWTTAHPRRYRPVSSAGSCPPAWLFSGWRAWRSWYGGRS
ncbi:hypothetical protein ACQP1S_30755 [Micromonospora matsumotoense]|uniref:hypothetical protein n=1 Tax=Micromonospora matsumotoense TaxID=121616 RepID=UPI003D89BCD5